MLLCTLDALRYCYDNNTELNKLTNFQFPQLRGEMTTGWLDFPGFTIICLIPGHADDNAHKGSGVEAGEGAGRSAATTQ